MKRRLIVNVIAFLLLVPLLFTTKTIVRAASPAGDIPGVSCGVAGGENGIDKCCSTKVQGLPGFPFEGLLKHIPGIGPYVELKEERNKQFRDMQSQTLTQCMYGQAKNAGGSCTCQLTAETSGIAKISEMCKSFLTGQEQIVCNNCANSGGFYSGFGCVPLDLRNFIGSFILTLGIGLGGLVSLLCIIYSAFILQTSAGNAEKVKKARSTLTSCITGLLLIIFSIFILRLIGVSILHIPGFG